MSEEKTNIPGVEETMRKARAEGTSVKGQFSIDNAAARKKMADFRLEDPWGYGVELFLVAVRKGASWVAMHIAPGIFEMVFDGRTFTSQDFENIYSNWFVEKDANPDRRASGQLGLALNAVSALNPSRVEVTSGDGERGARLLMRRGKEDIIESLETARAVTRIWMQVGVPSHRDFSFTEAASRTIERVEKSCCHASCRLTVNGKLRSHGLSLPNKTVQVPIDEGSLQGVALVAPDCYGGEVRFLMEGIVVETVRLPSKYNGIVVLVTDERFERDISAGRIIHGEAFTVAFHRAKTTAKQVLENMHEKKTHVFLFKEGYGATPDRLIKFVAGVCFGNEPETPVDESIEIGTPTLYLSSTLNETNSPFQGMRWMTRPGARAAWVVSLLLIIVLMIQGPLSNVGGWAPFIILYGALIFLGMLGTIANFHFSGGQRFFGRRAVRLQTNRYHLAEAIDLLGIDPRMMLNVGDVFAGQASHVGLRIVGEIESTRTDRFHEVFTDLWATTELKALRIQTSRSFSVRVEGHEDASVTIEPAGHIWLEGPYRLSVGLPPLSALATTFLALWINKYSLNRLFTRWRERALSPLDVLNAILSSGEGVVLKEGDRVEIIATPGTWHMVNSGSLHLRPRGQGTKPLLVRVLSSASMTRDIS